MTADFIRAVKHAIDLFRHVRRDIHHRHERSRLRHRASPHHRGDPPAGDAIDPMDRHPRRATSRQPRRSAYSHRCKGNKMANPSLPPQGMIFDLVNGMPTVRQNFKTMAKF